MTGRGRGRGVAANQALSPAKVFPSAGPSGAGASSVGSTSLRTISPSAVLGQKQQRLPSIGIEEEVDDDPDLPLVTTSAGAGLTRKPNKITTTSVPAFLNKLFSMVNDPASNELIRWSDEGDSFIVSNVDKFGKDILPRFFKHSNFGSFVRQLNMYGFHKVPHLQNGALKQDEGVEFLEFSNPNFLRGQPDLLCLIKRQKSKTDATENALDLPALLTDLQAIRKHQSALSADLKELQTSNQALWQEALQSRERYTRQSETINKILRFLASVFGGQVVETTPDFPSTSAGNNNSSESQAHVVMPVGKSRLLLEDVQRQRQRERSRSAKESASPPEVIGHTEDEIEEIPLQRETLDAIPSFSSKRPVAQKSLSYSPSGAESRFATIPSPPSSTTAASTSTSAPRQTLPSISTSSKQPATTTTATEATSADSPPKLPSEFLSMLSPKSAQAMTAFLSSNPTLDLSALGANSPSLGTLLPLNSPSPSSNPYASSSTTASKQQPSSSLSGGGNSSNDLALVNKLESQNAQIKDLTAEKEAIDKRTTQLEQAIARLMQGLPTETRQQLERGEDPSAAAYLQGSAPSPTFSSLFEDRDESDLGRFSTVVGGNDGRGNEAALRLIDDDEDEFDVDKYLNEFAANQNDDDDDDQDEEAHETKADQEGKLGQAPQETVEGASLSGSKTGVDDFARFFDASGFDPADPVAPDDDGLDDATTTTTNPTYGTRSDSGAQKRKSDVLAADSPSKSKKARA